MAGKDSNNVIVVESNRDKYCKTKEQKTPNILVKFAQSRDSVYKQLKDTHDYTDFFMKYMSSSAKVGDFVKIGLDVVNKISNNLAGNVNNQDLNNNLKFIGMLTDIGTSIVTDATGLFGGIIDLPGNWAKAQNLKYKMNATSEESEKLDQMTAVSWVPGLNIISGWIMDGLTEEAEKKQSAIDKGEEYKEFTESQSYLNIPGMDVQGDLSLVYDQIAKANEAVLKQNDKYQMKDNEPEAVENIINGLDGYLTQYMDLYNNYGTDFEDRLEKLNSEFNNYLNEQQGFTDFSLNNVNPLTLEDVIRDLNGYLEEIRNNEPQTLETIQNDADIKMTERDAMADTLIEIKNALTVNAGFDGSAEDFQAKFPTMSDEQQQKYASLNTMLGEIDTKFRNMPERKDLYVYTHEITIQEAAPSFIGPMPLKKANGDIVHGPTHALIGEAGPEAIIPLSAARRGRGLSLWQKAGQMMGVGMFADGGIVGDISQAGTGGAFSISLGGVNISVSADGGDSGNIVAAIKSALPEVTNTIAAELAQMLSKTFQNMPNRVEGVA